ncbi:MAG: hypothetical protein [Asgard archaea virus SkuldV2]|nr:MAG: hypothetical protein [Asgard archaea virus SkuldV2]
MKYYKILNYLGLIFGLISSLVLLITLYLILLNQNLNILIRANTFNEFWFEFIMISIFTIIILIALIIMVLKKEEEN